MRNKWHIAGLALVGVFVAACTTDGTNIPIKPIAPAVEAALAVPCQEAAGDKYYMDPDRVIALSSSSEGKNTVVILKADVRDAVCTLSPAGKVVSIIDTTPKSADQLAAEEAKAAEAAGGSAKDAKPAKADKKQK